jgi:hypothetical protein
MADTHDATGVNTPNKCAHSACNCGVTPGKRFCSDYCEKQSRTGSAAHTDCDCGHPPCKAR